MQFAKFKIGENVAIRHSAQFFKNKYEYATMTAAVKAVGHHIYNTRPYSTHTHALAEVFTHSHLVDVWAGLVTHIHW